MERVEQISSQTSPQILLSQLYRNRHEGSTAGHARSAVEDMVSMSDI